MKFGSEKVTPITPTFIFSPVNLATLGATEYTLVGVTADRSGSVRDSANAIIFVITDGLDYCGSATTPGEIKKAIERAMKAECLESIVSVLIGVNVQEPSVADALKRFSTEAGFSQYVELADANASTLAKLASFVSRSISSQSQSLGTGGPSKALTF